jgi:hypothetical protein
MKWTSFLLFLVHASYSSFGLFLAFPFCLSYDGFGHRSFIGFFHPLVINRNPSSNNNQATTYESSTIMKFKRMKNCIQHCYASLKIQVAKSDVKTHTEHEIIKNPFHIHSKLIQH